MQPLSPLSHDAHDARGGGAAAPPPELVDGRGSRGGGAPVAPLDGLLAGLRLALGAGDGPADRRVLSGVTDWPATARLAMHHRVGTLFLKALRSNGIAPGGAAVGADLARRRGRDVLRGMRQLDAMRRATAGLAEHEIPVLVLKGLPLGQRLYGSPFATSSIDVDLLVAPDRFPAAGRVLCGLGWRRSVPDFRETSARARWQDALKDHVFTASGEALELHRRLLANPFLFDAPFERLHAAAGTVEIGGCPFRTLGDADQLLYLACHGSLTYWQRLKWLCDFAALLGAVGDGAVERAVAGCRRRRLEGVVAPALRLCREALHVETPARAFALCDDAPATRFVIGVSRRAWTPRRGWRRIAREAAMGAGKVFMGRGFRYRLREMRGFLMQPHDFGEVDLPDRLFWLYVPLRPVLWLRRALRRDP